MNWVRYHFPALRSVLGHGVQPGASKLVTMVVLYGRPPQNLICARREAR